MAYLVLKSLHVISIICWMAGLLYLPRLFVYHVGVTLDGEASQTFKVMERRLLNIIMTPAMLASWSFGLFMIYLHGLSNLIVQSWFVIKLTLVFLLTSYHMFLAYHVCLLSGNHHKHGARFYRILNEVPTLIMIAIIFLTIMKPF